MNNKYQLHGRQNSGSWAIQVALEEVNAPYETYWYSREASDVEKLLRIIPTGKVPALVLPEGGVMFESAAMLILLGQRFTQLAPAADHGDYPKFLQWMVFMSANLYESALRMYYAERYSADGESDAGSVRLQATEDYVRHLKLLSEHLGPYVLGANYSVADIYLYMLVTWFTGEREALLAAVPKLRGHVELLRQRAAIRKVDAQHNP
jgi:glutathione S-transferase